MNNYAHLGRGPIGPSGIQGGPGPVGPSMSEWMPPEQYKTMCEFMDGKISFKELKIKAREYLSHMKKKTA